MPVVEDATCRLFSQAARRLMITRSEDEVRGDEVYDNESLDGWNRRWDKWARTKPMAKEMGDRGIGW